MVSRFVDVIIVIFHKLLGKQASRIRIAVGIIRKSGLETATFNGRRKKSIGYFEEIKVVGIKREETFLATLYSNKETEWILELFAQDFEPEIEKLIDELSGKLGVHVVLVKNHSYQAGHWAVRIRPKAPKI